MNDMSAVIAPRSDQINADDLQQTGPRTITISKVSIKPGTEQPVSMAIEGDNKVFRPCKSMFRVIVALWGKDANLYAGRSLTLYCDPDVTYGPLKVGGIRISHASNIAKPMTMALTATRANKKPFTVKPLVEMVVEPKRVEPTAALKNEADEKADRLLARINAAQAEADLHAISGDPNVAKGRAWFATNRPDLDAKISAAFTAAFARLAPPAEGDSDDGNSFDPDDGFPVDLLPKQAAIEAAS